MKVNLIVIKTLRLEELKKQYELIGIQFQYHQHGKGSFHYSAELDDLIFEIYPLSKSQTVADNTTRLGFTIKDFKKTINRIQESNWKIISKLHTTEWGTIAIIKDLDGRKVELKSED